MIISIKRVYDGKSPGDGRRILVDRLWPRGISKAELTFDVWAKDLAPSPSLREWFGHLPERFPEFSRRYIDELKENRELDAVIPGDSEGQITLLYAAKDPIHNHAAVLAQYLRDRSTAAR